MQKTPADVLGSQLEIGDCIVFPTGTGFILAVVIDFHPKWPKVRTIHVYESHQGEIRWKKNWKYEDCIVRAEFKDWDNLSVENHADDFGKLISDKIDEVASIAQMARAAPPKRA